MSAVEKRADEEREASTMKVEIMKEQDMLQLEKQSRMKSKHREYLRK